MRQALTAFTLAAAVAQSAPSQPIAAYPIDLSASDRLDPHNAQVSRETYRGCNSVRVELDTGPMDLTNNALVVLPGRAFDNGVLELRVAGEVADGADPGSRGFVGLAFRVQPGGKAYEAFYLRPTNGRADDQLRRNHSLQYVAEPDFPWQRLRQETPGVYESYADLEPGVWTTMRIEVQGSKARLFVNGASQPSLIVNDLKHGSSSGAIALWVGPGSIGHFCSAAAAPQP